MQKFSTGLFKALVFAVACMLPLLFVACEEDDQTIIATISLERSALYIATPSTTELIRFTTERAVGMSLTGVPTGWDVTHNFAAATISVTSPAADDTSAEKSGVIYGYVYSETSTASQFEIYVSSVTPTSLADQRSNCYVITEADHSYSIPVDYLGEGSRPSGVSSVKLLWQSDDNLISHLDMISDNEAAFHVAPDGKSTTRHGNALLGGYTPEGELVWTWHLWVTSSAPRAVGRYMDRNLGADGTAHATHEEILRSYGTYYQWGRLTPFIGPKYYNCASAQSADLYLLGGASYATITYQLAEGEAASTDYALTHPLVYLLSEESLSFDWNASHPTDLWLADSKSLYDPCPKGWRVADNFDDLTFAGDRSADLATLEAQFGWELSDGENLLFFPGAGRRSWLQGSISNVNAAETPKPWIGYYWTATTEADHRARALYFSLDTENPEASEFENAIPSPRANGMQVRCIKE